MSAEMAQHVAVVVQNSTWIVICALNVPQWWAIAWLLTASSTFTIWGVIIRNRIGWVYDQTEVTIDDLEWQMAGRHGQAQGFNNGRRLDMRSMGDSVRPSPYAHAAYARSHWRVKTRWNLQHLFRVLIAKLGGEPMYATHMVCVQTLFELLFTKRAIVALPQDIDSVATNIVTRGALQMNVTVEPVDPVLVAMAAYKLRQLGICEHARGPLNDFLATGHAKSS